MLFFPLFFGGPVDSNGQVRTYLSTGRTTGTFVGIGYRNFGNLVTADVEPVRLDDDVDGTDCRAEETSFATVFPDLNSRHVLLQYC